MKDFLKKTEKEMKNKPEFEARKKVLQNLKTQINLSDFLIEELGYERDRRKSSQNWLVLEKGTDKVIVKGYPQENGNYYYYNPLDEEDRGTIIDFLRNRGKSWSEIVNLSVNDLATPQAITPPAKKKLDENTKEAQEILDKYYLADQDSFLARKRKLSEEMLRIFGVKSNSTEAVFKLELEDKVVSTLKYHEDGRKFFQKDAPRGLSVLYPKKFLCRTERKPKAFEHIYANPFSLVDERFDWKKTLIISESPIDGLSLVQMMKEKSWGGESEHQKEMKKQIYDKLMSAQKEGDERIIKYKQIKVWAQYKANLSDNEADKVNLEDRSNRKDLSAPQKEYLKEIERLERQYNFNMSNFFAWRKQKENSLIEQAKVSARNLSSLSPAAFYSTMNVEVLSTCGSLSNDIRAELISQVKKGRNQTVYLAFDNDLAGRKMSEKVQKDLDENCKENIREIRVLVPGKEKDFNDLLRARKKKLEKSLEKGLLP